MFYVFKLVDPSTKTNYFNEIGKYEKPEAIFEDLKRKGISTDEIRVFEREVIIKSETRYWVEGNGVK